jgi:hypothetical protein
MAEVSLPEQLLNVAAAYQRDVALAQIDMPLGERRDTRCWELLRRCAEHCSREVLLGLRSVLAASPAASRSSLQRLQAWSLRIHIDAAVLPQQQALHARQRTATCVIDEEVIPLLASFAVIAREKRRDRRAAIEAAVGEQLADLTALFEAQFEVLQHLPATLEYPTLEALWSEVTLTDLAAQEEIASHLLKATQEVYVDLLHWAVRQRLGIPPGQLRRHDILALFTFGEYHAYYQPDGLFAALLAWCQDLGLDPRADGRLALRQRAAEFGPPAALALHIPDEIVLSYSPVGGFKGGEALASAYGQALLWAYTAADLPLSMRLCGEAALPLSNAQLFAETIMSPRWLRHYLRVQADGNYWSWLRLDRLYRLRRQLGRFLYTRYVSSAGTFIGAQEAYRELMMQACLVDYPAAYYLVDWDWQYTSVDFIRGWSVAYGVLETIQHQFDADWFRNPEAGEWLRTYWQHALGEPVTDLLKYVWGDGWDAGHVATRLVSDTR